MMNGNLQIFILRPENRVVRFGGGEFSKFIIYLYENGFL